MNELETRALLTRMAHDPAPPMSIDVDRAIATAHHQKQRTRWMVAAAAAVVLLLMVGLVTIFKPDPQDPSPTATPKLVAPTRFDPTRTRLHLDWLPDGLPYRSQNTGPALETLVAARTANSPGVIVNLAVKGYQLQSEWEFDKAEPLKPAQPGPDINGTPSKWYPAPDVEQGGGWLRWEWAPGAQAMITIYGRDDARNIAVRIAKSLRADDEKRIALPFTSKKPVDSAVESIMLTHTGDGPYGATVQFARERDSSMPTITLVPTTYRVSFDPNTTVKGRPAAGTQNDIWFALRTAYDDHTIIEVKDRAADTEPASLAELRAQCADVLASLELVGDLSEPDTWSQTPFG